MKALVVVDLQNDFLPGGALAVKDGFSIMPVINQLLEFPFDLILGTKDWHPTDHTSFAISHGKKDHDQIQVNGCLLHLWPIHCVQGTYGAEFSDRWNFHKIKKEFHKGTQKNGDSFSVFYDDPLHHTTGLHEYLQDKEIKDLYFAGLTTEYCIKYSVLDAVKLGYHTYVIIDACKPINVKIGDEKKAIQEMLEAGAQIINSKNLETS